MPEETTDTEIANKKQEQEKTMEGKNEKETSKPPLNPLGVIALFLTFSEFALGFAVTKTTGQIQIVLTVFAIIFPTLAAIGFFYILYNRSQVFYPPSEFGKMDPRKYAEAVQGKPAGQIVINTKQLKDKVTVFGRPDEHIRLMFKVKGATWVKSTKAMRVPGGCIIQVTSEQINPNGSISIAEALTFVPNIDIKDESEGDGMRFIALQENGK